MRIRRGASAWRPVTVTAAVWAAGAALGFGQVEAPLVARGSDLAAVGERLYRHGIAAGGSDVPAIVQGDLRVRSTEMACVNCHRRSGWGAAEGPVQVPPIVGPVLFAPVTKGHPRMGAPRTTGLGTRPPYDDASLLRALRDGVDPAGRALSPSMPRYAVGDADGAALAAYLRSLSAVSAPGVDEDVVHLATVVTPGVSEGRRASLLGALRAYVRSRNAGTRNETARRERGPWDMTQHYENYRNWVLHEWELQGSPRDWPVQLAELYRQQPVFAVVSGLGQEDWAPIHDLGERLGVPMVLPQTPLPPASGESFYALYFSRGVTLEAETLAPRLGPASSGTVQVSRCGGAGEAAATVLARMAAPSAAVRSHCLGSAAALTAGDWRGLLDGRPDTLVLWLGPDDLAGLETLAADSRALDGIAEIYVSSSLMGEEWRRLPATLAARARLLSPSVAPDALAQHAWRSLAWLKTHGVAAPDPAVAVNALFAAMLVGDALSHPRTLVSREYFLERIEHMSARSTNRSAYPAVSFGPRRRFGSSACQILPLPSVSREPSRKVGEWHVANP